MANTVKLNGVRPEVIKDHGVSRIFLLWPGSKNILPTPSVVSAQGGASKGQAVHHCPHCGRKHKGVLEINWCLFGLWI